MTDTNPCEFWIEDGEMDVIDCEAPATVRIDGRWFCAEHAGIVEDVEDGLEPDPEDFGYCVFCGYSTCICDESE